MTAQRGLWIAQDGSGNGTTPKGARLATGGLLAHDGATPLGVRKGVVFDGGGPVVTGTAGMSYDVRAFVVATMASSANGPTIVANDATVNVATGAAPGSGSRIDVVWVRQKLLAGDGGSETGNEAEIGVTQGVASGSPSAPAIPTGALSLAQVTVTAGTTATNTLVFTRSHQWTAAAGGVVRVESSTERAAISLDGSIIYYAPSKVHQALIDGVWRNVGGVDYTTKMQSATNVPVPSGSGGIVVDVLFPTPFAATPAVTATQSALNLSNPRIYGKSATGFTIRWDRSSAGSYTFDWIAVLP